jgi:hypothetical protein
MRLPADTSIAEPELSENVRHSARPGMGTVLVTSVARLLPVRVRTLLRETRDLLRFAWFMRTAWPPGTVVPSDELLDRARTLWGNTGFSARTEFLRRALALMGEVDGPVLECGSGLSTVLAASVAVSRGVLFTSLEHDQRWLNRIRITLRLSGLPVTVVRWSPLRDFGDFAWYQAPPATLPDRIALVLCDGPPGSTHAGRVGLVPRVRARLAPGARILLDDADRDGERRTITQWAEAYGVRRLDLPDELSSTALLALP